MEGNKKNKSRALLIFGAPCSGTTTFSEKFAAKYGLTYYNFTDIVSSHNYSHEEMLVILDLIAKTKQTLVIEGLLDTEKDRTEMRNILRNNGYEPSLIWIQTDFATIKMRLKSKYRSVSKAKDIYDKAVNQMEAPAEYEKAIILSGKHTFETQTKHVLAGLADLSEAR